MAEVTPEEFKKTLQEQAIAVYHTTRPDIKEWLNETAKVLIEAVGEDKPRESIAIVLASVMLRGSMLFSEFEAIETAKTPWKITGQGQRAMVGKLVKEANDYGIDGVLVTAIEWGDGSLTPALQIKIRDEQGKGGQ